MNLLKITLALLLILLFTNLSLAQNNTEDNIDINKTNNQTNPIYSQSTYICYPNNQTNNTILGECFTFTIYGLNNNKNLDNYIYDEELNIYWLKQGISLHLIFHNESYDLGIRNISYDEYIDVRNKIVDYHNGQRIKSIEYNYATGNNKTTYYISDNFIQVRLTNNTIYNETYYYANDKLVAKKDNSGTKTFYHSDHLGSTTLVTNQSGHIVEENFFLPFGDIYSGLELARHLFTGKEFDKLVDLYYYGARYYQASNLFRFIQPDSIIPDVYNPQSLNRYSYVLNNPYKYVDESGNIPIIAPILIGAGIGAGSSIITQYYSTGQVNWADVGKSAAIGAVSGLAGGAIGGAVSSLVGGGTASAIGSGAVAGFGAGEVGALTESVISGEDYSFDPTRALTNALAGGIAGGVGSKFASSASTSRQVSISDKQVQSKFYHAGDFGIKGNYNKKNAQKFKEAIQTFVNSKDTQVIQGTYRGTNQGTHYYNPSTRQWVFKDASGKFRTGFKLEQSQVKDLTVRKNVK
ncbi:MAG: colicin D domain-containing protein [Nanoarchaeota archaeon]